MLESPKLEHMGSESLSSISEGSEFGEKGAQKISVCHQINGMDYTGEKAPDSFIVDIELLASQLTTDKDINGNSTITLQRGLPRKGSQQRRVVEKKSNTIASNERDNKGFMAISPRGSLLHGGSPPEKPMVVVMGTTEHSLNTQVHNPITIITGSLAGQAGGKSSTVSRRFSFRRSSYPNWIIDPRRILLFFATLSSMGTILLIFFTLSMNKFSGDDNVLN
ncbi:hypothetical protein ACH5RR_017679 [Cinchona calisaya]|uniref:Uncharacterized protein n=1 Tax=Cinchona calisaya TaxID=153742 RepID=A0ABD2ZJ99_9GENT